MRFNIRFVKEAEMDKNSIQLLREEGAEAFHSGYGYSACPHPIYSREGQEWRTRWLDEQAACDSAENKQGGFV